MIIISQEFTAFIDNQDQSQKPNDVITTIIFTSQVLISRAIQLLLRFHWEII